MLTPAILAVMSEPVEQAPQHVCVIWRRDTKGCWDYVCRAPDFDVERIIMLDQVDRGTKRRDYQVTQG